MIRFVTICLFLISCVSVSEYKKTKNELNECLDQKYDIDNCQREIDGMFFELNDLKYAEQLCKKRLVLCNKRIQNVESRCK